MAFIFSEVFQTVRQFIKAYQIIMAQKLLKLLSINHKENYFYFITIKL